MKETSVWFELKTGKKQVADDRRIIEQVVHSEIGHLTSFNMLTLDDVRFELHNLFDQAIDTIIKNQKLNGSDKRTVKIEFSRLEKSDE